MAGWLGENKMRYNKGEIDLLHDNIRGYSQFRPL